MFKSFIVGLGLLTMISPISANLSNENLTAKEVVIETIRDTEESSVTTSEKEITLKADTTVPAGTTLEFIKTGHYDTDYDWISYTVYVKGTLIYSDKGNRYGRVNYVVEDGGELIYNAGEDKRFERGDITVKKGGKFIANCDFGAAGGDITIEEGATFEIAEGCEFSLSSNAILKGIGNPTIKGYVTCGSSSSVNIRGDITIESLELTNLLYLGENPDENGNVANPSTLTVLKYLGGNNQVVIRQGSTLKYYGESFKPRDTYDYQRIWLEKGATLWFSENLKELEVPREIYSKAPSSIVFNSVFDVNMDSVRRINYSKHPGSNINYASVVNDNGNHIYLNDPKKCIWCDGFKPACTEHKWEEKVDSKASLSAEGKVTKTCSECDTTETVTVAKIAKIAAEKTELAYNGKNQAPVIVVTDAAGNTLKKGTDYSVTLPSKRKAIGAYTATVKFKGKYSGSKAVKYTIVPKGTTISTISPTSKGFKLTWKKQATETNGYEIQYSTASNFKDAKIVKITKNSTLSKTVSKLSGKKKYFVRIRTYKTVGSKKYYSAWSKSKSITTKK